MWSQCAKTWNPQLRTLYFITPQLQSRLLHPNSEVDYYILTPKSIITSQLQSRFEFPNSKVDSCIYGTFILILTPRLLPAPSRWFRSFGKDTIILSRIRWGRTGSTALFSPISAYLWYTHSMVWLSVNEFVSFTFTEKQLSPRFLRWETCSSYKQPDIRSTAGKTQGFLGFFFFF